MGGDIVKKYLILIMTILTAITIFFFSAQDAIESGKVSNTVYDFLMNFDITATIFAVIPIRKFAHSFIFFILSFFTCSLLKILHLKNSYIKSYFLCVIYACFDEFHQLFINGRHGCITDVFIDMIGIMIGIILVAILTRLKKED